MRLMYNPNRPEWHLGDELVETPQSSVWSCPTASESFDQFNRLAVALAKSQDRRNSSRGFSFGLDRQGALADGLHGLNPRNTDTVKHPTVCRPALIERLVKDWVQRWNKAQSISESIRPAHLVDCVFDEVRLNGD